MKKNLCRVLSLLLAFCTIFLSPTHNAFAKEKEFKYQLSKFEVKSLKEKVESLSDSEFDKFILDYIRENQDFEYSVQTMAQMGVTLNLVQSSISNMSLNPSAIETFDIFSAHRGHDKFTRIIVNLQQNEHVPPEENPGTLDVLSIEWDPTVAKYYSTNTEGHVTYRDGSQRSNGLVVFNVDDSVMLWGIDAYAAVYVTPIVSGAEVEIGSKYTHTYTEKSKTTTTSIAIQFTPTGVTGGFTYTVIGNSVDITWDLYTTNAFIIESY